MGDSNTPLTESEARHLLRRTGFGALPRDVSKLTGVTRGKAVEKIVGFRPSKFLPRGRNIDEVHDKWVKHMVSYRKALQEKLVLFWHDHFATGNDKVLNHELMALQNQTLRRNCKGNFKDFVKAINKDPAMMEYLDTVRNRKQQPNENYARELMELFTLGVDDFAGNPNYAQEDIVQIARAFTGWRYNGDYDVYFDGDEGPNNYCNDGRHDYTVCYPARGPKVIFKTVGGFQPSGRSFAPVFADEGPLEVDAVIDIIFDHTDTDGKNTVARHITHKLISYFAHPDPAVSFVDAVIASSKFATPNHPNQWSIQELLRAVFVHDDFYLSAQPAGAGTKKSFKWPIDYAIGTLRILRMKLSGREQYVARTGGYVRIADMLANMGQTLLEPPSVFGWDWEEQWASSQSMLERYRFARNVTGARDGGSTSFRPEKLIDITLTDPGQIVDAVTTLLGVKDDISSSARQAMITYIDPNNTNFVDLQDFLVRNVRLNGLFALVLESPAYQLH
jgi:uncharacterized protein (DUF1800 family)